ncbi:Phage protein [Escherichia coli O145:H28 str. RM12761]|nr:Phage protein [Escherichia coli O145:H28 str. RM13516]AHY65751.1 Phage protein [Escherichia coli O145:H28 str. RM12761]
MSPPGRPSVPEVRLPPPGQPHLFLLSVPVGLPGLPHRYLPLDPVDLHFPSDRSLPALPCHLSAPAGLPDQHHLPVPVRRLPRQGRCHRALPYHPSAPEDPRAPVPPLAREVPPRWGFGLRLLPPLSCFVPLTVRFLLTPGLFLLRSLHPWLHYRLHFLPSFLTIQLLLHFVMTHWLFERPQRPRTRTPPLTALQRLHFLPPAGLTPMHPLLKCQHLQRSLLPDWLICRHSSLMSPPLRHSSSPPQRDAPLLPPSVQNDAVPPAGRHPPTWHRENHSAYRVENLHTR